jgi:hypothetical protein
MKKRWYILLMVAVLLIVAFLPLNFLNAGPVNYVQNGSFETAPFAAGGHWNYQGNASWFEIPQFIMLHSGSSYAQIWQSINLSGCNALNLSFDFTRESNKGELYVEIKLYKDGSPLPSYFASEYIENLSTGRLSYEYNTQALDFNSVIITIGVSNSTLNPGIGVAYIDNVELTSGALSTSLETESAWVRDTQMKCKQVWINSDGDFQFSFIYPYADNNWVKIYDMAGNLVYKADMPYDNPNIIVDLPDGMYAVKTFNDQPEPIQEFVIGKP